MEKLSDLLEMAKVSDIIATKKEKEDNNRRKNKIVSKIISVFKKRGLTE